MVEKENRNGETVDHLMVKQWNSWGWNGKTYDGGIVEQRWWISGTVEHLIVEQ